MSLSSLTRLAVSRKVSSVGEYMLGFSRFVGLGGGTKGDGWLEEPPSMLPADCSSCICNQTTLNIIHECTGDLSTAL